MKWWCISFLKFRTPESDFFSEMAAGNTSSSSASADSLCPSSGSQRVLVTRWWTCGCRSEVQRVAGPPRPPPRCRCPRGWGAVWYGPRSSAGYPGGWGPWLHLHLTTGKTHHPPHSDWRCGSHQKWADWPSPSVLLSSKSVRVSTMSIRSNAEVI